MITQPLTTRRTKLRALGLIGAPIVVAVGLWAIYSGGTDTVAKPRITSGNAPSQGMAGMGGMTTASNGSVRVTAEQIRQFGITFGTAEIRAMTTETRTTGVVAVDEARVAQVAPKIGGFVEKLYVNATGQRVSRGQPMLELYSTDLVAAQQELLLSAQLQRDMGRSAVPGVPGNTGDLVAASRRRLQLLDISENQIDAIVRTGQVRRTLTLYAPVSGVVIAKRVLEGQAIMPGEALFTVADLSGVWIDMQVREADASGVQVGSRADIQVTAIPERVLKGTVAYVYPTLDSITRGVRARVAIANSDGALKPGMYATVRILTRTRSALTVPSSALLRTGERNVVFTDLGKGELMPMDVQVGRTAGEFTEIVSGLATGSRVVTSAQFLLDSESNLGEVMKSMLAQPGGTAAGGASDMTGMKGMPMPAPVVPRR